MTVTRAIGILMICGASRTKADWDKYLRDVYGEGAPRAQSTALADKAFFYWSAPFAPESIKIWTKQGRSDVCAPRIGDGVMFSFVRHLGFWRWAGEHAALEHNSLPWMEVLRASTHKKSRKEHKVRVRTGENQDKFPWQETDRTGLWHFTAPGSGLWLNLGSRTADKTNELDRWQHQQGQRQR